MTAVGLGAAKTTLILPVEDGMAVHITVNADLIEATSNIVDRYRQLLDSDDDATRARLFPAVSDDPLAALQFDAENEDLRGLAAADAAETALESVDADAGQILLDDPSFDAWVKVCANVRRIAVDTGQPDVTDAAAEALLGLLFHLRELAAADE